MGSLRGLGQAAPWCWLTAVRPLITGSAAGISSPVVERHHVGLWIDAERRRALFNRIHDIARGQMAVVLLHHARVRVAQIARNYHQRDAVHHGMARPGVAENMKRYCRLDLRVLARFLDRFILM